MRAIEFINSLSDIETRLDTVGSLGGKLEEFQNWLAQIHKFDTIVILDYEANKALCTGKVKPENVQKKEFFDYIRSLPLKPNVIVPKGAPVKLLSPHATKTAEFIHLPLISGNKNPLGALLLVVKNPRDYLDTHRNELKLVAIKMRDLFMIERLYKKGPEQETRPLADFFEGQPDLDNPETARHFIEMMNFPMFIIQTDGGLVAVNQSLLAKLKFKSLCDFSLRYDIFQELFQHGEVLATLKREGGVRNRRLSLHDSTGERVTMNMSVVCINGKIVGSLFDVSEYVKVTDDLRESLKMQEFLNDKLISAALLLNKTQSSAIRSLARLAEFRDHETGDHLQRICEYSQLIAKEVFRRQPYDFKIRSEYCDDIFLSSMLHDIGKVGIPDQILLKKGKLDEDEWKIMKGHTVIGWTILNQADCELGEQSFLTLASQIALNHHERWDGSGYPYGLRADKIPLSARISAVADVYDALTSHRPYKQPWNHEDAVNEIKDKSDVMFDPVIVDILLSVEKKILDIHYRFPK